MKDHPILFSGPMVRALLDGSKTQTRRVGKVQSHKYTELGVSAIGHATKGHVLQARYRAFPGMGPARWAICEFPYGLIGDRLWVQESHQLAESRVVVRDVECWYPADDTAINRTLSEAEFAKFRMRKDPYAQLGGRFMYRSLSRITLEITGVKVERLQSISIEDARAEGIPEYLASGTEEEKDVFRNRSSVENYRELWDSIYGKREGGRKTHDKAHIEAAKNYSWDANPWVWCLTFKRVNNAP